MDSNDKANDKTTGEPAPAQPPPEPQRRVYVEIQTYSAQSLLDVLLVVAASKRTGSLTINFAGGKPDGTIEFKQRIRLEDFTNGTST